MPARIDNPARTTLQSGLRGSLKSISKGSRGGVPRSDGSWRGGTSPLVLYDLAEESVNLVTWPRALPAAVGPALLRWAQEYPAFFDEVICMQAYDLSNATQGLTEPIRTWIRMDIALLLARFAAAVDASRLRVSFGAIRNDQCRKFHIDFLRYRLITTYLGPGTEWVPDEAVRHEVLNHPVDCPHEANARLISDQAAIRQAQVGDVLVMKGARHETGRAVVHRSPSIQATGQLRVVLIANTIDGS